MSAPLLIDGRVVGDADINRRVVIRAYAPCLAWKTIFYAGDNSCRPVTRSLSAGRFPPLPPLRSLTVPSPRVFLSLSLRAFARTQRFGRAREAARRLIVSPAMPERAKLRATCARPARTRPRVRGVN